MRHVKTPMVENPEALHRRLPEYATSVGITLRTDGQLDVIAPHGLEDLFSRVIRRNPTRVSVENYRRRLAQKRYAERWPRVLIVPC